MIPLCGHHSNCVSVASDWTSVYVARQLTQHRTTAPLTKVCKTTRWALYAPAMSLSHLLRKINQPNTARAASVDAVTGPSPENHNELSRPQQKGTETISRRWGKKKASSADDRLSPSIPSRTSTPPIESTAETPTSSTGAHEKPLPMPPSVGPGVFLTNLFMEPLLEMPLGSGPAPDRLTETWNMVKDGPSGPNSNRRLDALGASWVA